MDKIKIGVIGVGHLGKIHLHLLKEAPQFELTGFFDTDDETCRAIKQEHNIHCFSGPDELIEANNAIDIVTPTTSHFLYAQKAVKAGKHIFIEKPVTETPDQARELKKLVKENGVKAQVGHVERYNPAMMKAIDYTPNPKFIEGHRLAEFNPRGAEVSVVMDLMIHDIDLACNLINAPVQKVSASGVAVVSDTPDISNARITFENGAVANLTASRISVKKMRKLRIFQKNAYMSIDLLSRKLDVFFLNEANQNSNPSMVIDTGNEKGKEINFDQPTIEENNAIKTELEDFAIAIQNNAPTRVDMDQAHQSLTVATEIQEQIEEVTTSY